MQGVSSRPESNSQFPGHITNGSVFQRSLGRSRRKGSYAQECEAIQSVKCIDLQARATGLPPVLRVHPSRKINLDQFPEQTANFNKMRQQLEDGTFKFKKTVDPAEAMKPRGKGPFDKAELDATCRLLKDLLNQ